MAQRDSRSRNWMGVVYHPNNVTHHPGMIDPNFSDALNRISELPDFIKHCKYFVHGSELCPTTATQHLQCFFVFKNDQSLANLRSKFTTWFGFNSTIAWKKADSNTEECIAYCMKDNIDVTEFGTRPKGKGARSDLAAVGDSIKAGFNMSELFDAHPASFLKFAPGMQKAVALVTPPRDWKTEVFWVHGPTGTGKSRWVMRTVDRSDLFVKDGTSKWFDGYANQKTVLFDDFRPSKELPFSLLLRLLDRYPVTVEGKGYSMNFAPERIFITTPLPPLETFQHLDWMKAEELAQLTRRITQVIHFPNLDSLNQYALLSPFVMIRNDWGNSVGQQTRVRPAVAKTQTTNLSLQPTGQTNLGLPTPIVQPLNDEDSMSETSSMGSIEEVSGDSEPEDGDSLHSEALSQDSTESDNSFIAPECVSEEDSPLTLSRQKKSTVRRVLTPSQSIPKKRGLPAECVKVPSNTSTSSKKNKQDSGKKKTKISSSIQADRNRRLLLISRHSTSDSSDSSSEEDTPDLC